MNHAIILAAGKGQRAKTKVDKMLLPVAGKPLIYYTLIAYNDHPEIDDIVVVCSGKNKSDIQKIVSFYRLNKVKKIVTGGSLRQDSLGKGIAALGKSVGKNDLIAVHNGANPLPSFEEISECLYRAAEEGACIAGHFISSTVKEVDKRHVLKTHDRRKMFAAETPQIAQASLLEKALKQAVKSGKEFTDEAMMMEDVGQKIAYVEAHEDNFKITTPADYERLKMILGELPKDVRIGIGQDSHFFEEEKRGLVLGGLSLKDDLKLKANSDGDVILHALFNAFSQSIGDMSLGFYADEACEKGVKDSKKYLEVILKKIKKEKLKINSVGVMIECARPKIDPLVSKLKKSLSTILSLPVQRIGITATSGEKCTAFGEGLGIQCFAIVSLIKN